MSFKVFQQLFSVSFFVNHMISSFHTIYRVISRLAQFYRSHRTKQAMSSNRFVVLKHSQSSSNGNNQIGFSLSFHIKQMFLRIFVQFRSHFVFDFGFFLFFSYAFNSVRFCTVIECHLMLLNGNSLFCVCSALFPISKLSR